MAPKTKKTGGCKKLTESIAKLKDKSQLSAQEEAQLAKLRAKRASGNKKKKKEVNKKILKGVSVPFKAPSPAAPPPPKGAVAMPPPLAIPKLTFVLKDPPVKVEVPKASMSVPLPVVTPTAYKSSSACSSSHVKGAVSKSRSSYSPVL